MRHFNLFRVIPVFLLALTAALTADRAAAQVQFAGMLNNTNRAGAAQLDDPKLQEVAPAPADAASEPDAANVPLETPPATTPAVPDSGTVIPPDQPAAPILETPPLTSDFSTPATQPLTMPGEVVVPHSQIIDETRLLSMEVPSVYPQLDYKNYPFWFGIEYVNWTASGSRIAPLVTSAPTGTPAGDAGILSDAETTALFGGDLMEKNSNGVKYTLGTFIDPEFAFFGQWTQIQTSSRSFVGNETTHTILTRPFTSTTDGSDSRLIVYPGITNGSVGLRSTSEFFTPELLLQEKFMGINSGWLNFLYGYRHMSLEEDLAIIEQTRALSGVSAGTIIDLNDTFIAKNRFHGGTFGLKYDWTHDERVQFSILGKISYGATRSRVHIGGMTTTTDSSGFATQRSGGLLTQPTNIGTLKTHNTTPIFELGATARIRIRKYLHATLGYTFISWRDIARVADQVDTVVNPTQINGTLSGAANPALPSIEFNNYSGQAIRIGLEYTF